MYSPYPRRCQMALSAPGLGGLPLNPEHSKNSLPCWYSDICWCTTIWSNSHFLSFQPSVAQPSLCTCSYSFYPCPVLWTKCSFESEILSSSKWFSENPTVGLSRSGFREDQVIVPKKRSAFFHMTWICAWWSATFPHLHLYYEGLAGKEELL